MEETMTEHDKTASHEKGAVVSTTDGDAGESLMAVFSRKAFPTGFMAEFRSLRPLLPSVIFNSCCQWYAQPIALMFAGHLGKLELDSIGLACTLINVFGFSIFYGLSSACDVAFAQTYGGNNLKLMSVYLQRCLFLFILLLFPIIALYLNMESLLLLIGQDPEVSKLCARYMLIFIPGLIPMAVNIVLQRYFQCQNILCPDIWIGLTAHGLHSILQYLLLYVFNMGIDGSSLAQQSYYFISVILRIACFCRSEKLRRSWEGWSRQCLIGWGALSKIGFYGVIMTCSEWWLYEIATILAGLLGTTELATSTILVTLTTLIGAIPLGLGQATLVQLGQQLGAGHPLRAKTTSRIGPTIGALNAVFFMILLLSLRNYIGLVFTNVQDVLALLAEIMPVIAVYCALDGITAVERGIYRGAAKQSEAALVIFMSYYLIALPTGICLMFLTDLGLFGMWLGFLLSITLNGGTMFIRFVWFFDWETISVEAQKRACVRSVADKPQVVDARTRLLTKNLNDPDTINDVCLMSATVSVDLSVHILQEEEQPVTTKIVLGKVVIIGLFVASLILGIVVRFATAPLHPTELPPNGHRENFTVSTIGDIMEGNWTSTTILGL